MRRPRQEQWRVIWKHVSYGAGDEVGEFIVFDFIPHIKKKGTAGLQNASRLAIGLSLIREEHHPELAHDGIECGIGEWQGLSIGFLPADAPRCGSRRGVVEHGLVEIGS